MAKIAFRVLNFKGLFKLSLSEYVFEETILSVVPREMIGQVVRKQQSQTSHHMYNQQNLRILNKALSHHLTVQL